MVSCTSCGAELVGHGRICPKCLSIQPEHPVALSPATSPPQAALKTDKEVKPDPDGWLEPDEEVQWRRNQERGFFLFKTPVAVDAVTDRRIVQVDLKTGKTAEVRLADWPDVVLMNAHRVSNSLGGGIFVSPRSLGLRGLGPLGGVGAYGGPRHGTSTSIGDLSIYLNRHAVMTFSGISDPQGVKQLIETLKRESDGRRGLHGR